MTVKFAKNLKREKVFINKYGEKVQAPGGEHGYTDNNLRPDMGTATGTEGIQSNETKSEENKD